MTVIELENEKAILKARGAALINRVSKTMVDIEAANALFDQADKIERQIDAIARVTAAAATLVTNANPNGGKAGLSTAQLTNDIRAERSFVRNLFAKNPDAAHKAERIQRYAGHPQNAASSGAPAGGGYAVAPVWLGELQTAMKLQGGVREVARTITTASGVNFQYPTLDDRGNAGFRVSAENAQLPNATDLLFGSAAFVSFPYSTGVLLASVTLVEDSYFDFDSLLQTAMAGRFVRAQNPEMTIGSGAGQMQGVVSAASPGVTGAAGSTSSVTADNLTDLLHSVDPVYRRNAHWMMHDSTLQFIRKLKDGAGHYMLQTFVTAADGTSVDTLLGRPVQINNDMPIMAPGARSVLFGDFQQYVIRDVLDFRLQVLRERYADFFQVGYIGFMRTDARLVSAAQPIKYYANSAT